MKVYRSHVGCLKRARPWEQATLGLGLWVYFCVWSGIQKFIFVSFSLLIRLEQKNQKNKPPFLFTYLTKKVLATVVGPEEPGQGL